MLPGAGNWLLSGQTGVSSLTIFAVLGCRATESPGWSSVPLDPSDFGRCHRLLLLFPDWRFRLSEVADVFPEWRPMVEVWDRLEELYREESPSGSCPRLYKLMSDLRQFSTPSPAPTESSNP